MILCYLPKEKKESFQLLWISTMESSIRLTISNADGPAHLGDTSALIHGGPVEVDLTLLPKHSLLVEVQHHPDYLPEDCLHVLLRLKAWLDELDL
jgi:hypothetical protein